MKTGGGRGVRDIRGLAIGTSEKRKTGTAGLRSKSCDAGTAHECSSRKQVTSYCSGSWRMAVREVTGSREISSLVTSGCDVRTCWVVTIGCPLCMRRDSGLNGTETRGLVSARFRGICASRPAKVTDHECGLAQLEGLNRTVARTCRVLRMMRTFGRIRSWARDSTVTGGCSVITIRIGHH